MEQTRNKTEQLEWQRNKVNELSIKGFGLTDISKMLQIPKTTISRDIEFLKQEAKETIRNHIQEKLPYEYKKCISGLDEIIKEGWIIAAQADKKGDSREKLQSLALIKDTYNTKMDLLTNASLLQDSIKFVEEHNNNKKEKLPCEESSQGSEEEDLENGIQGPTEDYTDQSTEEQYNEVF
ncbi:MAG TPA: hypothetical protein VFM28_00085 [Nitrososphaeraceae archaeon]|nr:hypothetical protein [Nitrososphaeraceae archaeon]